MDTAVGDLVQGDVHVRDGAIIAVAPRVAAPRAEVIDAGGMIVMPGFVETHWHLWNSLMKNMVRPGFEYAALKAALIDHHTPDDFYKANRLALTEATNAGFTTVLNFAHNTRSPAHVDSELKALAESGLRGRYSYGWIDPMPPQSVMPLQDAKRVRAQWFERGSPFGGKVDLGIALRGPASSTPDVYAAEYRAARDFGASTVMHIGQSPRARVPVAQLVAQGLLDRDTLLVHGVQATAEDRAAIAHVGASVSWSPQSELRLQAAGDFREELLQMTASGINMCLSMDSTALATASMFDAMNTTWNVGVPWAGTPSEKLARIDFTQCLQMATINGARALGLADKIGSLTPGKRADIIMVRTDDLNMSPRGDVRTMLVRSATPSNVDTVMVDGELLKFGGRLLGVDSAKVIADANASLDGIRRRAGGSWAPSS